jgi:hypothetical protein
MGEAEEADTWLKPFSTAMRTEFPVADAGITQSVNATATTRSLLKGSG